MRLPATSVALGLAAAALAAGCARDGAQPIEVQVRRVAIDPASGSPVVLLEDPDQGVALPIWIGPAEAQAIDVQLSGDTPARPLTHDLMKAVFDRIGVGLQRVVIRDLREGTYFADVVIEQGGEEMTIDSRPSDAIALAVRYGQPIFVERELFGREAVVRVRGGAEVVTVRGITVQALSSDLARYFDLPPGHGVLVAAVEAGGAHAVHRGDVILEIDGQPVRDPRDFRSKLDDAPERAALRLQREGEQVDVALERGAE